MIGIVRLKRLRSKIEKLNHGYSYEIVIGKYLKRFSISKQTIKQNNNLIAKSPTTPPGKRSIAPIIISHLDPFLIKYIPLKIGKYIRKAYSSIKEKINNKLKKEKTMKYKGRTKLEGLEGEIVNADTIKVEIPNEDTMKKVSVDILETANQDIVLEKTNKEGYDYVDEDGIYYDERWLTYLTAHINIEEAVQDKIYESENRMVFVGNGISIFFSDGEISTVDYEADFDESDQEGLECVQTIKGNTIIDALENSSGKEDNSETLLLPTEKIKEREELELGDIFYVTPNGDIIGFTNENESVTLNPSILDEDKMYTNIGLI